MSPEVTPGSLRDRLQGTVAIPIELCQTMRELPGMLIVRYVDEEWEVRFETGEVTYLDGHRFLITALLRLNNSLQDKEIDDD